MRRLTIAFAVLAVVVAGLLLAVERPRRSEDARRAPSPESAGPDLAVGTGAGRGASAEDAGGVPVATAREESAGGGWRARVKVASWGTGGPVSRARVHLVLDRVGHLDDLGWFPCDAAGTCDAPLPRLDALSDVARSQAVLRAEATGEGHRTDAMLVELSPGGLSGPARTIQGVVELLAGPSVRGRVLDGAGAPVPGADVVARAASERHDGRTDDEGRFAVRIPSRGSGCVEVSKDGIGGAVRAFSWPDDPSRDLDAGTLVLDGDGSVRGTVVLGDGRPAVGVPIHVFVDDDRASCDGLSGAPEARAWTDVRGAFHLRGLRLGEGWIDVPGPILRVNTRNADPMRIELAGHLVRVRVRDEKGEPWYGAGRSLGIAPGLGASFDLTEAWDGLWVLAEPSSRFLLWATVPGCATIHRRVEVGPGVGPTYVDLEPRALASPAHLSFSFSAASGSPVAGIYRAYVTVRSPDVDDDVARFHWGGRSTEPPPPLPPGLHRIHVLPLDDEHPDSWDSFLLAQERIVDLAPGATTELTVPVVRGGRLRLTVDVPVVSAGPPSFDNHGRVVALEGEAVPDGGGRVALETWVQRRDRGISFGAWVRPGVPFWPEGALPAGSYDVRLRTEGYEEEVLRVRIDAGRFTDATVQFRPRK